MLWGRGIDPEHVLVAGDEFGALGGLPGSDSLLVVPEAGPGHGRIGRRGARGRPARYHVVAGDRTRSCLLDDQLRDGRIGQCRHGPGSGLDLLRGRDAARTSGVRVTAQPRRRPVRQQPAHPLDDHAGVLPRVCSPVGSTSQRTWWPSSGGAAVDRSVPPVAAAAPSVGPSTGSDPACSSEVADGTAHPASAPVRLADPVRGRSPCGWQGQRLLPVGRR